MSNDGEPCGPICGEFCDDFCEQEQLSTSPVGSGDAFAPTVMTQDHTG